MRFYTLVGMLYFAALNCFMPNYASAQDVPIPVGCGAIIEAETTTNSSSNSGYYYHVYGLDLSLRDTVTLVSTPIGQTTQTQINLFDPSGRILKELRSQPGQPVAVQDFFAGAGGTYTFQAYTSQVGAYVLTIECLLADGTLIKPGQSDGSQLQPTITPSQPIPTPTLAADFYGFPGLAPIDFANAFRLPLTLGTASVGEIPIGGDAVLGFKFEAAAGDKLNLNFNRTSGNLNLGLVVLSADNKVAYMAALVSSETMNTTFTLPSSGEYTIGIFRIDLIPPAAPEATGFEILAEKG